ncbi:hypothetical protein Tco_0447862 [Tanacetum coccineum]
MCRSGNGLGTHDIVEQQRSSEPDAASGTNSVSTYVSLSSIPSIQSQDATIRAGHRDVAVILFQYLETWSHSVYMTMIDSMGHSGSWHVCYRLSCRPAETLSKSHAQDAQVSGIYSVRDPPAHLGIGDISGEGGAALTNVGQPPRGMSSDGILQDRASE